MNLPSYDAVFTFRNLYVAHLKARRCKRHKKDAIEFEMNMGPLLAELEKQLRNRTYHVSGYNHFVIYEPKERNIQSLHYFDRIVQHCLVDNYLMPLLENHLIYDNGACRKNKGTDFSRNRIKMFLTKHYQKYKNEGYVLQFDIHHYFQSINHSVLKEKITRLVPDQDILNLLLTLIDSYEDDIDVGLPMGNQTSQCFALYYLDSLDRLIKEKYQIKFYSRYMDDGIIILNDKTKLQFLLNDIKKECGRLKIELNVKKTKIKKLKDGFAYLGFRYNLLNSGKILMRFPKTKRHRIVRFLRKKKKDGNDVTNSIMCIKEHANRGKEYNFISQLLNEFEIKLPKKKKM